MTVDDLIPAAIRRRLDRKRRAEAAAEARAALRRARTRLRQQRTGEDT